MKLVAEVTIPLKAPVAPFTGAWIETWTALRYLAQVLSRPLHGGVD